MPSQLSDSPHLARKRYTSYKAQGLSDKEIEAKETTRCIRLVMLGNFLEYYDLTLFIHVMFLLSPLFLPHGDYLVERICKVFVFSSAYLMRPVGALFWGWIGDRYGRAKVLTYTMLLMGVASTAIPSIPSYGQWGAWSTVCVVLCRFLQGFAAGGELYAAKVYIAEASTFPKAYFFDGLVSCTCSLGRMAAGAVATVFLYFFPENGWKMGFWFGSILAFLGMFARHALVETHDFINAIHKKILKNRTAETSCTTVHSIMETKRVWDLRIVLFFLYAMGPIEEMFTFGYCPEQLAKMNLAPFVVTAHSTAIAGIFAFSDLLWGGLAYYTNKPFTLHKSKALALLVLFTILFFSSIPNTFLGLVTIQIATCIYSEALPLTPLFVKGFPILSRCTNMMLTYSITKALMYGFTTYTTLYLSETYGPRPILGIIVLFSVSYVWASFRAQKLLQPIMRAKT